MPTDSRIEEMCHCEEIKSFSQKLLAFSILDMIRKKEKGERLISQSICFTLLV